MGTDGDCAQTFPSQGPEWTQVKARAVTAGARFPHLVLFLPKAVLVQETYTQSLCLLLMELFCKCDCPSPSSPPFEAPEGTPEPQE